MDFSKIDEDKTALGEVLIKTPGQVVQIVGYKVRRGDTASTSARLERGPAFLVDGILAYMDKSGRLFSVKNDKYDYIIEKEK